ncbi:hypothetical protein QTP70_018021 [Hemibagrus guttatus]|uniref:ribonuclease H n=1 Tax=Hemibagrus guttatus TaxID=175788 RepID=A0AAE0PU54_9TELE|nr:hypothetical protein QTP70_018021 [Hemibagrus guttatus]
MMIGGAVELDKANRAVQVAQNEVVLPDDWETTAEVVRETGRKVLGVSSGRRKEDKETWWWNEEVQDSIQRKRLAKKKWDMDRTEENRQEYKELQRRVKREVSKAKQKAYDELYTRLDTREGEKDLYRLARQRDRDGKDVQQVRVIKDRDERVLTSEESVQRRWKEYFEELMNEENEREKRVEGVNSVEQKVDKIRKDEVRKALKRMKSEKAVGPDDIPVEVWKCLGEAAVEFLANRVLESERMPEEWRRSVLVPIFKNKGDVQSCSNYRGIKLMSHTMKLWERVVEARLRKVVEICEQQYGFMPRKSTTDAIFALRILMEKYRDGQRELHCVFVDLEKAYDRVPREELWYCMRKSGVAEKYVRVVQDMYERSRTVVRCAVGQTEEFNVEVGLHQGSALSPFLFAIVMDQLSEEVRQESPWTMMFADDIVICSESREQVEENLERWRFALERRGMKVSRSKTEYMCVNEREGSGTVRLQGEEVKKVQEFKYLGSTVQSNGECGKENTITQHELAEDGSICEEKKKLKMTKPEQLLIRMNLNDKQKQKMKISDVLQITSRSLHWKEPCPEKDLVETFLQRMLMMEYRARYITTEEDSSSSEHTHLNTGDEEDNDDFADFLLKSESLDSETHKCPVHPMDVQMAVFHCSDRFLKQLIVTKLAQCQYALPLLVPNPFTREIEFPLWTFRQIRKSWKTTVLLEDTSAEISQTQAMSEAQTPMVAFFRLGSLSSSKSQLMNSLINEKHHTFFHRHCPGSSKNRLLVDGVVEIAWFYPSRKETDYFSNCVAFCNLHGDAEANKEQLEILTEMSSVNVVLFSNSEKAAHKEILQKLYRDSKPLICLLSEDESGVSVSKNGKYRIGLKDRNHSDVAKNLRTTIQECLSKSLSIFRLEYLDKPEVITKDEDDHECKSGKEAAVKIMSLFKGNEVSKLKEKFLPCQGKLWHDWCKKNKDLHRIHGDNLENQKSKKQREMMKFRKDQHEYRLSSLMDQFTCSLNRQENERTFFLKWLGILLDKRTSDDLSELHHKYNEKWKAVLDLKKNRNKSDQVKVEQNELEEISEKLNAATFGLEHIIREMGQIYESFISVQTPEEQSKEETLISLPKLAAELMKSGHPLELMDGDAAHVPLTWVSAVLDELVKILGDQRVFVLSILGIQSSGKSTMLNAMFGLQFAVSAGRCTRGAFMQLVRVSEEMKELKFDYILVVDTEGLRALELAGKSTQHHDNELATFVVGLGNLTLINIFGENPAEMQDILQIVIQAFLRMKKVRLNPSCLFVHQNVGDITAGEKNMEGRRRLQEKLDEMTKLAAKEEDCEADCFSDVIEFNVQNDVYYFAQLWEGSPPMAAPNPSYSRNVQDLKKAIFNKATLSSGLTLSHFKSRISDLWNALINENFVFSFKNTLEIAVYRKLENEFGKWTWALRSAMLITEETLYNRIETEKLVEIKENDLYSSMKKA